MSRSSELIYAITRNHNAFLHKNLHGTFTSDPFSATNFPNAGQSGFHTCRATGLAVATGKKAEKGQVVVLQKQKKRRITKKGKKHNIKARGYTIKTKTVASKKVVGNAKSTLAARGVRLHQAAIRAAKQGKQNK